MKNTIFIVSFISKFSTLPRMNKPTKLRVIISTSIAQ